MGRILDVPYHVNSHRLLLLRFILGTNTVCGSTGKTVEACAVTTDKIAGTRCCGSEKLSICGTNNQDRCARYTFAEAKAACANAGARLCTLAEVQSGAVKGEFIHSLSDVNTLHWREGKGGAMCGWGVGQAIYVLPDPSVRFTTRSTCNILQVTSAGLKLVHP